MKLVLSFMSTRRIGAACDTAHISVEVWHSSPGVATAWIVRFETERQKVSSAPLPVLPGRGHAAVDGDVRGVLAQAVDLRVVPDLDVRGFVLVP